MEPPTDRDRDRDRERRSATTLARLEANDPALRSVSLNKPAGGLIVPDNTGVYCPTDGAGLARIGAAIGNNTNVRGLFIHSGALLRDMAAGNATFLEGLQQNTSIAYLIFDHCDIFGAFELSIVNGFLADSTTLGYVWLRNCPLDHGRVDMLASALAGCARLSRLSLNNCNMDSGLLAEFMTRCSRINQLKELRLAGNHFGSADCEAIATLLQNPTSKLVHLSLLHYNLIDDDYTTILARSLHSNRTLKRLDLTGCAITRSGWGAFSKLLCNSSSVETTFRSNHTLYDLGVRNLPSSLSSLLALNRGVDKKQVVVEKILRAHPRFKAHLFLGWDLEPSEHGDLKVLPFAVSWCDRASAYSQNDGSAIDGGDIATRKLSLVYQFAKAMPLVFVPPPAKALAERKKRKLI